MLDSRPLPTPTIVHFKVSPQGITLTDSERKLFFRYRRLTEFLLVTLP